MKKLIGLFMSLSILSAPAVAHDFGFAGILDKSNREELPELILSSGKPIADAPLVLKSGTMYEVEIVSDGSAELALEGPGFFRAIWVNDRHIINCDRNSCYIKPRVPTLGHVGYVTGCGINDKKRASARSTLDKQQDKN